MQQLCKESWEGAGGVIRNLCNPDSHEQPKNNQSIKKYVES